MTHPPNAVFNTFYKHIEKCVTNGNTPGSSPIVVLHSLARPSLLTWARQDGLHGELQAREGNHAAQLWPTHQFLAAGGFVIIAQIFFKLQVQRQVLQSRQSSQRTLQGQPGFLRQGRQNSHGHGLFRQEPCHSNSI